MVCNEILNFLWFVLLSVVVPFGFLFYAYKEENKNIKRKQRMLGGENMEWFLLKKAADQEREEIPMPDLFRFISKDVAEGEKR